jgi:nucleoside phosphorylase/CheY-like chemotaxis protein
LLDILILDDNREKVNKICEILKEITDLNMNNVDVVPDIISAKRLLTEKKYDLLILDIQVPNRFDQTTKVDGGIQLLNELKKSEKYNIPSHIIGITAYEESITEVNYSQQLLAFVKYDESTDEWSKKMCSYIEYIIQSKRSSCARKYDYDLAIICALDKIELESIKRLPANWKMQIIQDDSTIYYTGLFKEEDKNVRVIAAAAPQMGMIAASVLTTKIIYNFCPKYLAIAGITAGIKGSDIQLGDVIVADPSWDYGSGKIASVDDKPTFQPDPQPIRIDADIKTKFGLLSSDKLDKIRHDWPSEKPNNMLKVYVGPVASGSAVLAHSSAVQDIQTHSRKLVGVDMETYGVLYAAANGPRPKPIAFSIKSVCDYADSEKNDQYQMYAAYTSSSVLYRFALDFLNFD